MSDDISQAFRTDVTTIPLPTSDAGDDSERAVQLMAHVFLRLWTRMALETGQKMHMSPSQYTIGTYNGKMNWMLNSSSLEGVDRIEIRSEQGKEHMLVAELYELNGQPRTRVFFSLAEDEVKGKPLFVTYLVYDEALKDFDKDSLATSLAAALPHWYQTLLTKSEGPLWEYARDKLECVGV